MKFTLAHSFLLLVIIAASSCRDHKNTDATAKIIVDTIDFNNPADSAGKTVKGDTLRISYAKNKEILDLIPLIPDSAMKSWEWSKAERVDFLNEVKKNNYFVDTTPNYNNIHKVLPNYFTTQVVDGSFVAACYKANDGTYLLITCDIVGDGRYLQFYNVDGDNVRPIAQSDVLMTPVSSLWLNKEDAKCQTLVEEAEPYADYDFSIAGSIIYSLPVDKKQADGCLKGNTVRLVFNPTAAKFDVQDISWQ